MARCPRRGASEFTTNGSFTSPVPQAGITQDARSGRVVMTNGRLELSVETKAGSGQTARQFARELAGKDLRSVRLMTREHPEAASWDQLMQEVRLRGCPAGTLAPPFPQVEDPPMLVSCTLAAGVQIVEVEPTPLFPRRPEGPPLRQLARGQDDLLLPGGSG